MKVSEILLGGRPFFSASEIANAVNKSTFFDPEKEDLSEADLLRIFKTSTQQSWLVFTNEKMYFVLDDMKDKAPDVRWTTYKDRIVQDDRVIVDLKLEDKTEKTGRISIGQMKKGFLYSKRFFEGLDINARIFNLITKNMLP